MEFFIDHDHNKKEVRDFFDRTNTRTAIAHIPAGMPYRHYSYNTQCQSTKSVIAEIPDNDFSVICSYTRLVRFPGGQLFVYWNKSRSGSPYWLPTKNVVVIPILAIAPLVMSWIYERLGLPQHFVW